MADEGQPLVEDDSLRDITNLYSELQYEIIWLQGEIAKLTDDNPCKPALIAMLESLEKMVKDFKEAGQEEDVWEHSQLEPRARSKMKVNRLKNMDIAPYVYRRFVATHGYFGSEFYGVGKGCLADHQHAQRRIPRPIPRPPVAQFLFMAHPETGPTGPSHNGGYRTNSRPSYGDRSHIPRYVSNVEVYHMSVEDLHSLYFECRDYIHGIDYVDSAYDMEHGQALFLDAIVDDAC
eukprot:Gb_31470 [translate_table: standard]